jgi:DUF971 family protein/molybdopterin converting factor small subunit
MTDKKAAPAPTEIALKKQSAVLDISFDDGSRFSLPCRYLRVFSPAAEAAAARNRGERVAAPEDVTIEAIEPVGTYAVKLVFSDGHDAGVYSWKTLYRLGADLDTAWPAYLARFEGVAGAGQAASHRVKLLYFATVATRVDRDDEELLLPPEISDIGRLINFLARRGEKWRLALLANPVQVTVNRQFAKPDTAIRDGDEIGFVPAPRA